MPDGLVEQEASLAATEEVTNATESATGEQQESQEGQQAAAGVQKRIDKAVRAQREAEREREFWKQEALKGRTTTPAETQTTTTEAKGEPSENDFETHAAYVKALTKWTANQAVEEFKVSQRKEAVTTRQQTVQQEFKGRQEAFKAATPDFDEVISAADVQVSNAVITEIVESENGPALQYYLAKNPDEAERLSKLAPLTLAREVGKIESRFSSSQQKTAVKTTAAPPPPNPTGKSSATSTKDPGEMNPAEYRAWRAKQ